MKTYLTKTLAALVLTLATQGAFANQEVQTIDGVSVVTQNVAQPITVVITSAKAYDYYNYYNNSDLRVSKNKENSRYSYIELQTSKGGSGGTIILIADERYNKSTDSYESYEGNKFLNIVNKNGLKLKSSSISEQLYKTMLGQISVVSEACPLSFTFDRNTFKILSINAACDYKSAL